MKPLHKQIEELSNEVLQLKAKVETLERIIATSVKFDPIIASSQVVENAQKNEAELSGL